MRASRAALVLLFVLGSGAARGAEPLRAAERAIWVWEPETYAMLESRATADATIAFLADKRIGCAYLYADAYRGRNLLADSPKTYGELIRRLRERGIGVYALIGSWYLHTEQYVLPERHDDAAAALRRVLEYNARAPEAERFAGVNLDIEPHMLKQWNAATREGLLQDFVDLGRLLMSVKRDLGATIPIGPAIPFWLDGITLNWGGAPKPASEHMIDTFDYVALMDYRDHAEGRNGTIALAGSEMEYAARTGKRVVIGLDVSPGEPRAVSFDHLRESDLEATVATTETAYRDNPAFGGFVIHHLAAYRAWLARTGVSEAP